MKRLLVVMLLMQASYVQADVYNWTDARGIAHYTNKEYEIPERYKAMTKPLHIEAVQPTPRKAEPPKSQESPSNPRAARLPPPPAPIVRAPSPPAPAEGKSSPRGKRRGIQGMNRGPGQVRIDRLLKRDLTNLTSQVAFLENIFISSKEEHHEDLDGNSHHVGCFAKSGNGGWPTFP